MRSLCSMINDVIHVGRLLSGIYLPQAKLMCFTYTPAAMLGKLCIV